MQQTVLVIAKIRNQDGWQVFSCVLLASMLACAWIAPATVHAGANHAISQSAQAYDGPQEPDCALEPATFAWPTSGLISQKYWGGHQALDIAAPYGSAVLAADEGQVHFAGWTDTGYGYLIILDHGWGYTTHYAHLSRIHVSRGQTVSRGQKIGTVGSTGNSTGPHLHLEIRYNDDDKLDPLVYLSSYASGDGWGTCPN